MQPRRTPAALAPCLAVWSCAVVGALVATLAVTQEARPPRSRTASADVVPAASAVDSPQLEHAKAGDVDAGDTLFDGDDHPAAARFAALSSRGHRAPIVVADPVAIAHRAQRVLDLAPKTSPPSAA